MSTAFEIRGGRPLHGTIVPQGAKNEALQVLCASLLTSEPISYTNVPDIIDVNLLIELLEDMGVKVTRGAKGEVTLQADNIDQDYSAAPSIIPGRSAMANDFPSR